MSSLPEPRVAALFARFNSRFPSVGILALASLSIAAATGVALAAGFDVARAADSLALLELTSPSGRLVRSTHAWSSNFFLLFGALHAVEHLAAGTDRRMAFKTWLRLVLSIPLALGLALSGFMLKGDAEGELARQIVGGLIERLPAIGPAVSTALLGVEDDLQNVYVHHTATLTPTVALIVFEHGRRIWPSRCGAALALACALALGLLWPPRLHDGVDPAVHGPWYFVAVQEVLHWLRQPAWIWPLLLAPLAALAPLPRLEPLARRRALRVLAAGFLVYAGLGAFAQLFRGAGWKLSRPWADPPASSRSPRPLFAPLSFAALEPASLPAVRGRHEGCVACHREVAGLSPSHDPGALGCFSCHLGDPLAADASRAHRGMVRVPGNLDTAALTCGRAGCHDAIAQRVRGSLMASMRGVVAVDRWAFGEQRGRNGAEGVGELENSPADTHLRQLCVSCHLGNTKQAPGPNGERSRGGGCAACHASYPEKRDYAKDRVERFAHPGVSVRVGDEACLGCHSRSGRISLGYAGWWESGLSPGQAQDLPAGSWRAMDDGRVLRRATGDAHHEKGMVCIDCHTAQEVMGDGGAHLHEEQATRVRCETCHREGLAASAPFAELPPETRAIARLRWGDAAPSRLLLEDRTGEPLTNAVPLADGTVEVRSKLSGARLIARPPAASCRALPGHARLSCRSCHEAWVTRCNACHTQWDPSEKRVDFPTGGPRSGAYVEYDAPPSIGPPTLGVLERGGRGEIVPFAPGMILTFNGPDQPAPPSPLPSSASGLIGPKTRHLRAFAPVVPHTTARKGLSCAACHRDPEVLGYGKGSLALAGEGGDRHWRFEPTFQAGADGLPADAWIAPLDGAATGLSTRDEARPLNREEQERVLRVGACLECHDPAREAIGLYSDFPRSLRQMTPRCRGPSSPARAIASP